MKKHEGSIRNYLNINNIITIFSNEKERFFVYLNVKSYDDINNNKFKKGELLYY